MYDLGILGGGPAGYVAAERAGAKGLKVLLIEKEELGGVCLNEGCIPTKTLLYSAKMLDQAKEAGKYGISTENVKIDFPTIMKRKKKVIKKLVAGVRLKMKSQKVDVINATGEILEREEDYVKLTADGNAYECKNLMIATGASPVIPSIKGLDKENILTNKEILEVSDIPNNLVIIGGGVIGLEFASFFNSMGTEVTIIELMSEILPEIDGELSTMLRNEYAKKGVTFILGATVSEIAGNIITFEKEGKSETIESEKILLSVGRKPNIEGFGIEKIGVEYSPKGIIIDKNCRTNISNVFAAGDVTGFSLLAHTASREGEVVVNTITGRKDAMRYDAIPGVVYTNPEIATVGMTEKEAQGKDIKYRVKSLPMAYAGRFVVENEGKDGYCKVLAREQSGEILGIHMIGSHSSEMIYGAAAMIEAKLKLKDIEEIVFPHPTVSEIMRETVFSFNEG